MPQPEHAMLPHLVDLESGFEPDAHRAYEPRDLVRYALAGSDYWAELALRWLEQGVSAAGLEDALLALEAEPRRPQTLRHRARRVRQSA